MTKVLGTLLVLVAVVAVLYVALGSGGGLAEASVDGPMFMILGTIGVVVIAIGIVMSERYLLTFLSLAIAAVIAVGSVLLFGLPV